MPDPTRQDYPRRRELFGSGLLAAAAFAVAFWLVQRTGSAWALILLLPAMLLGVRTLVGIRRRRDVRGRPDAGSADEMGP